jgi:hypothetical protein
VRGRSGRPQQVPYIVGGKVPTLMHASDVTGTSGNRAMPWRCKLPFMTTPRRAKELVSVDDSPQAPRKR